MFYYFIINEGDIISINIKIFSLLFVLYDHQNQSKIVLFINMLIRIIFHFFTLRQNPFLIHIFLLILYIFLVWFEIDITSRKVY